MDANVTWVDGRHLSLDILDSKGCHVDGRGAACLQEVDEVAQGKARVQDVLGNEYVAPLDLGVEVLDDADDA